ncbi:MAG: cytochrome c [Usitatibacter sp.]
MISKRVLILLAASAVTTMAVAQSLKPETQLKLRKAAYAMMGYSFGSLAQMAEGKRPYSKDDAIRYADLLVQVSTVPKLFFGEGTDKGETRAKPEIWTHRKDFDAKMDSMVNEVAKLPEVARTGDLEALKAAVKKADDACDACHTDYRVKQR